MASDMHYRPGVSPRFRVSLDSNVTAAQVLTLMDGCGYTGWGRGTDDVWAACLRQALCVVSARDEDASLVGIGFLIGNLRHAEIVDLSVRPDVQRRGLGRRIVSTLVEYAADHDIRYLNLVAAPGRPWLMSWYTDQGFQRIGFALGRTSAR
jgi:GNAT superfamily N-acetyltransferase